MGATGHESEKTKREMRHPIAPVDRWLTEDGLALLRGWSRDGFTLKEIAGRIGITHVTLSKWRVDHPEIDKALIDGLEIVNYKVENALLKSALGYTKKEVKVTTTMRYGKLVETVKETTESEQAPNITAIQTWLYNRYKDKWKNMNGKASLLEDLPEDDSIEVIVRRAKPDETSNGGNDEIQDKDIILRKRSEEEQEVIRAEKEEKEKIKKAKRKAEAEGRAEVIQEKEDDVDLDEWPEDWVDEDEDSQEG